MRIDNFKTILFYVLLGWGLLLIGRLAFIFLFVPWSEISAQSRFLYLALWNAFRFDMQTLAYISAIPTVVAIVDSYFKRGNWIKSFFRWHYTVLYSMMTILIIADMCFYKNFHDHFNVTLFDFFNEEPWTLVQTFFQEYPIVWILVAILAVPFLIYKIHWRFTGERRWHVLAVAMPVMVFIAMRGSVVEFPLEVEDMYVSPSQLFNDCVPTPTYCLKKAIHEKKTDFSIQSEDRLLSEAGLQSTDEAWRLMDNSGKSLFAIKENTPERQPDIVVMLSESWSGFLLKYALENKKLNLLCGMDKHLETDIFLQNYQSVQNGTIATIENLLIDTPFPRVFMSKYRYAKFPTSFAQPFMDSGYDVTFMSGMDEGWENLGIGLNTLGIKKIFKYDLLKKHPEYKFNSVGIFDHHLMNSLYEYLAQPSRKPRLVIVMTTTNHPPFVFPEDVKLPDIPSKAYCQPCFTNAEGILERYFHGFQYANCFMARFLDRFKASSLKDNTIIVITGDHNARNIFNYADDGKGVPTDWEHRVPFYVYLPEGYRGTDNGTYHYNKDVWGCHYDIVTTLAPFAFKKGTRYLSIGQNLLSDSLTEYNSYSQNINAVLCNPKNKEAKRKASARQLLLELYLQKFLERYDASRKGK